MYTNTKVAKAKGPVNDATREIEDLEAERLERLEAAALGPRQPSTKPRENGEHARRITQQLRDRLIAEGSLDHLASKGIDVPALLADQTDDEIFLAHVQCPQCATLYLPLNLARQLMATSRTANDWLRQISDASMRYGHQHSDGTTRYLGYRPQRRNRAPELEVES